VGSVRVVVLEPQTFMNRSGRSVVAATQFYRVPPEQLVVVHDELDFDFGRVAVKRGGGHGGHNGLRDIIGQSGSPEFVRVRVGIGRPTRGADVSGWVLQGFDAADGAALPEVLDRACHAITTVLTRGLAAAMNETNRDAG
jgi:PTH1 family peptidyl-tRNA hydrolase